MHLQRDFVERVRCKIRGTLGYQSWLYRTAARMVDLGAVLFSEGLPTTILLERLRSSPEGGRQVSVKFRQLKYPITLRAGSRDIGTLISNAVRLEYGQLKLPTNVPLFIVDGGAYIGDTSSYFLSQYPNATIVALEPNPESFEMAKLNLEPYGDRVTLLNKALADKNGMLFVSGVETGAKVSLTGSLAVECATVADLITISSLGRISVLKLDIEGAEEALFKNDAHTWLDKVDHIIVETHGSVCEEAVSTALKAAHWTARRYRNLYYASAPEPGLLWRENQYCA